MVPAVAVSGVFAAVAGFFFSGSIAISLHDLILVFFFGALQYAPGFICLTLGSRTTPSAQIGIFAFTEAIAGPIWAWIFVHEVPPLGVLIGGAIIFSAILLKSFKS
jgi:drug/metabolite transporter (DMT)-like permease